MYAPTTPITASFASLNGEKSCPPRPGGAENPALIASYLFLWERSRTRQRQPAMLDAKFLRWRKPLSDSFLDTHHPTHFKIPLDK